MDRNLALTARFVVGLTWLYEGLWLKIWKHDPLELRVLANVFAPLRVAPLNLLLAVGCGEAMLAFGVLIGWNPRFFGRRTDFTSSGNGRHRHRARQRRAHRPCWADYQEPALSRVHPLCGPVRQPGQTRQTQADYEINLPPSGL